MRRFMVCLIFGAAALLSACGAAQVQQGANEVGTAVSAPEVGTALSEVGTAMAAPEVGTALSEAGTAMAAPEVGTALSEVGTAMSGPEAGTALSEAATAVSDALGSLSAIADDVTLQEGGQLLLDATQSVGDIKDYKWTIEKAPAGAEAVVGQTIQEGSSGNVSLNSDDYAKYFPTAGTYTVRLTVTDGTGATSYDDFTIEVP